MSAFSLIYVSRSLLKREAAQAAIDDIMATSVERNDRESITGALLYSGSNFVQVLEGPVAPVLRLMEDIKRDPRHDEVHVLETLLSPSRSFGGWNMAYIGDALFVRAHVSELLRAKDGQANLPAAVGRMRDLMEEFVRAMR